MMRNLTKVVTIGAIGYTAESFFHALQAAKVDTFLDIRRRRAVRGHDYAFANSRRLQARLGDLGIRYLHLPELAPTNAARKQQEAADKAAKVARRKRSILSQAFIDAYQRDVLAGFDAPAFLEGLPSDATVVALMCVEREPAACHRSLLAEFLHGALGVPVEHLAAPIR
jgi:uncharacterized protein (DUF488 family)